MKRSKVLVALSVGMLIGLLVGLYIHVYAPFNPTGTVFGVSEITLAKIGAPRDGEYKGAVWRIYGSTLDSEVYVVTFNQTLVELVNASAIPEDVMITSQIKIKIWQDSNDPPYWVVPFKKINTEPICVVPRTYGLYREYGTWGAAYDFQIKDKYAELYVDVYELDIDKAELHVPFYVSVWKEGEGRLEPEGDFKFFEDRQAYRIDLSEKEIVVGKASREVIFENPKNDEEWLKLTLQYTIGAPEYLTKPFSDIGGVMIIEPVGGGEQMGVQNTFRYNYEELRKTFLIGWQPENYNPWAYYFYWMSDPYDREGSVFKGNTAYFDYMGGYIQHHYGSTETWKNEFNQTIVKPVVWWNTAVGRYSRFLCEGYLAFDDTSKEDGVQPTKIDDYPGWRHPKEGEIDKWYAKLLPVQPELYFSNWNVTPYILSLCDYIATDKVDVPVEAVIDALDPDKCHSVFESKEKPYLRRIESLNPYCDLYAGGIPGKDMYVAQIPTQARSWVYTLDISSELADAIVVVEKYLDVRIENFEGPDVDTVQPGGSAVVTMDLVNKLDIKGGVQLIVKCDKPIPFEVSGAGYLTFAPNETKEDYQVIIKNSFSSAITEEVTGKFTLYVWNGEKITSSVEFTLTFLPGAGLPNTGIAVKCIDKYSKSSISSVSITVLYGKNFGEVKYGITGRDGVALITLDSPYEGSVKILANDNYGRYYPVNITVTVSPTSDNTFEIKMEPINGDGFNWLEDYLPYIIGGAIGVSGVAFGLYTYKKRREGGGISF